MQAFPVNSISQPEKGMTLRDYFARDFANTLITSNLHDEEYIQSVCKQSYVWADAMMRAREGV